MAYAEKEGKLEVTKEVVELVGLKELRERKQFIQSKLDQADAQRDAEYAIYQPQLDEVKIHIAEAKKLNIAEPAEVTIEQ